MYQLHAPRTTQAQQFLKSQLIKVIHWIRYIKLYQKSSVQMTFEKDFSAQ